MFFSLVQLFEYNIYKNINVKLNSKLLLLNLGLQGLLLFLLINTICKIDIIYILIGIIVFISILHIVINKKHKDAKVENCIKWEFLHENIATILVLSYFFIFHLVFFNKCIYNNDFLRKSGYFFLITLIMSFIIGKNIRNGPSYWCLSSAILSPLLLLL